MILKNRTLYKFLNVETAEFCPLESRPKLSEAELKRTFHDPQHDSVWAHASFKYLTAESTF